MSRRHSFPLIGRMAEPGSVACPRAGRPKIGEDRTVAFLMRPGTVALPAFHTNPQPLWRAEVSC